MACTVRTAMSIIFANQLDFDNVLNCRRLRFASGQCIVGHILFTALRILLTQRVFYFSLLIEQTVMKSKSFFLSGGQRRSVANLTRLSSADNRYISRLIVLVKIYSAKIFFLKKSFLLNQKLNMQ